MKSVRIVALVLLAVATVFAVYAGCGQMAPLQKTATDAPAPEVSVSPPQYGFQPAPKTPLTPPSRLQAGALLLEPRTHWRLNAHRSSFFSGFEASRDGAEAPGSLPAGALPSPGEELWVVQRPSGEQPKPIGEDVPGSGELRAKLPGETKEIPLPLKHTDVQAAIAGYIATVDVTQQYHNPYESKIEAVYVFPLPENAAVNEFVMTVGERKIRGIFCTPEIVKAPQVPLGHEVSLTILE